LKILIVSDVYPPEPRGGAKHTRVLAEHLSQRGHRVVVCTTAFPGLSRCTTEDEGVVVYRLQGFFSRIPFLYQDRVGRFPPPLKDWLLTKQLRKIIKEENPDIVHAVGWMFYSLLPALNGLGAPLVMSLLDLRAICPAAGMLPEAASCDMHLSLRCVACGRGLYGSGPLGSAKSLGTYLATRTNKKKLGSVDTFIVLSSYAKQLHMTHLGLEEHRFAVIPNFYDREPDTGIGHSGKLPEDFILFVGALLPAKGVGVLIKAYRRLNTETKLVVIGLKHPRYSYSGGNGVVLIENAPRSLVLQAFDSCRFAVFPSVWPESSSTVMLEAMAGEKAVVGSRIGGLSELIVDGDTGILVPPKDAEALSEAMSYLLQNPQVAEHMGQRGYERWKQLFTTDAVTPEIEKLYESLLGK